MSGYNFQKKKIVNFCLKMFLTFTNSKDPDEMQHYDIANIVDPDEMQHYAAFHLGLHFLLKYSFRGFPNTMG